MGDVTTPTSHGTCIIENELSYYIRSCSSRSVHCVQSATQASDSSRNFAWPKIVISSSIPHAYAKIVVFDLIEIEVKVSEHRGSILWCPE